MNSVVKWTLVILVMVPAVFVLEAFIHGGPVTVSENTRSVRQACRNGGGSIDHCECVASEFESRLDLNEIIMRRLLFVRETIPDKQLLYEAAERTCRNRIG